VVGEIASDETRSITTSCCGHAASGHAAAEPAIALMKSRRLMQPSAEPQNHANFKLKGYHIYDALYRH
jgi:hypothetical protein